MFGQDCPYIVQSGYLCDEPENAAACCGCGGGVEGVLVPDGSAGIDGSADKKEYDLKTAKAYSIVVVGCAAFVCLATIISYGRSWKHKKDRTFTPPQKWALQEKLTSGGDAYGMRNMSPFQEDSDEAEDLVFFAKNKF